MKPLIFFVDNPKDGNEKITLTKDELEDMLAQAYEAGRKDGFVYSPVLSPLQSPPSTPWIPTVTCSSAGQDCSGYGLISVPNPTNKKIKN